MIKIFVDTSLDNVLDALQIKNINRKFLMNSVYRTKNYIKNQ